MKGIDLKIERIKLGIQAKEIAKVLEVSNVFVSNMENGVKKIPKEKYITWIKFLGIEG